MMPNAPSSDVLVARGPGAESRLALLGANAVVVTLGIVSLVVLSASFDERVALAVSRLPDSWVRAAADVSTLGLSGYMFALTAAIGIGCMVARRFRLEPRIDAALEAVAERALYLFATLAASGILAQLIKHLVGRARPKLMPTLGPYHFDVLSMKSSLASFPSGHSATVFSIAFALGMLLPAWRVPLFTVASAVAVSRVLSEAHYISDIVVGGALGLGSAALVLRAFADWSIAFQRESGRVRLKRPGIVRQALADWKVPA